MQTQSARAPRKRGEDSPRKYAWLLGSALLTTLVLLAWRSAERAPTPAAVQDGVRVLATPRPKTGDDAQAPAQPHGQVVNAQGHAIPFATVCAVCSRCELTRLAAAACVRADAQGAFTFVGLKVGHYDLAGSAPGHAPDENPRVPVAVAVDRPGAALRIVLVEGGTLLAGAVLDALGGPIPGALVQATRQGHTAPWTVQVEADGDGRYAVWTSPGPIMLHALADGYAPALLERAAPADDADIVLTPASRIRGRVVEQRTGKPMAEVAVTAVARGQSPRLAPVLSATDGSFELDGVEADVYTLSAESEHVRGSVERDVAVAVGETIDDVVLQVVPAVELVGRVLVQGSERTCARGTVILGPPDLVAAAYADAELSAASSAAPVPTLAAQIDADGTARFLGATPGRYVVSLHCLDHVLAEGPRTIDVADQPLAITWKVKPGLGLTLVVVDALGSPVEAARVLLRFPRRGERGPQGVMPLTADGKGRVVVPNNLFPGTYSVRSADDLEAPPMDLVLNVGDGHVERTLRLRGSGRIVVEARADGKPVNGLALSARPLAPGEPSTARAEYGGRGLGAGRYEIGPLPPGAYRVEARDGTNPVSTVRSNRADRFDVGAGSVLQGRVELVRGASITGTALDEHGAPVESAWISARCDDAQPTHALTPSRVLSDSDGAFSVQRLAPGASCTVSAEHAGGAATVLRDVRAGAHDVRIALSTPISLAGEVLDPRGVLLTSYALQARHLESGELRHVRSNPVDRRFDVRRLPAGRVVLTVLELGIGHAEQVLDLAPGEARTNVRLKLDPFLSSAAVGADKSLGSPLPRAAQDTKPN